MTDRTYYMATRNCNERFFLVMLALWMINQGLTLSCSKSIAIMLTTKRGYTKLLFNIGGIVIELQDNIRYIDVELSSKLGFRKHIETANNKAEKTASALARLMPNVGRPMVEKRKLLTSVVHSQLLYISLIGAEALTL